MKVDIRRSEDQIGCKLVIVAETDADRAIMSVLENKCAVASFDWESYSLPPYSGIEGDGEFVIVIGEHQPCVDCQPVDYARRRFEIHQGGI